MSNTFTQAEAKRIYIIMMQDKKYIEILKSENASLRKALERARHISDCQYKKVDYRHEEGCDLFSQVGENCICILTLTDQALDHAKGEGK